ncbi:hypothetical protein PtrCC142_010606 [Pyrenophora tritici-repentis]|uniref:Uncharacterized protein n=2 Tax=Pyrenophora tritici-repentis TaxID=45151 RepID=A0A922SVG3_9PLEO|nr:uncharacterized protein PTRG_01669 [Pyrenophora tritici-repentis Pt-1C-BFP]KAI1513824.1 hypothetical protein Ptr86124_007726 [Pyrenophora tritici-repentis]EDU41107.1 conserved hypothetical protein [Pyrenophora tritici-repentis Pt-1C-BFP]KAI1524218.1 hypothetical protein PtrSN001C_011137 [Pyrenophora tritici-repentis]KAI1560245.1 hypothetical protein PtrEW4_011292 [Pyrenophora tritici-repentis]KAI1594938.1 hypothetical protein PtrCC142_010606 [Pyrenophora tritici-repentis]
MSTPKNTSTRSGLKIKLGCIQSALHDSPPPTAFVGLSSGLKIKLRCIQSALNGSPPSAAFAGLRRKASGCAAHPGDDRDPEIDMPRKSRARKVVKVATHPPIIPGVATPMRRNQHMHGITKPEHAALTAEATNAGIEYYDSDADDLLSAVKDTTKPEPFRNVTWGKHATDYNEDDELNAEPEFTHFVPDRFKLLPTGTVSDQKHKLVVKLIDKAGKKRTIASFPPRN